MSTFASGISTADNISETYAHVKDAPVSSTRASTSIVCKQSSSLNNTHPYAEVKNIGDATYAQISEKPAQPTKRQTVTSTVSIDTIDPSLVPPVPDKMPDLNVAPVSNRSSKSVGSPSLPPRNSILDSENIPFADDARFVKTIPLKLFVFCTCTCMFEVSYWSRGMGSYSRE